MFGNLLSALTNPSGFGSSITRSLQGLFGQPKVSTTPSTNPLDQLAAQNTQNQPFASSNPSYNPTANPSASLTNYTPPSVDINKYNASSPTGPVYVPPPSTIYNTGGKNGGGGGSGIIGPTGQQGGGGDMASSILNESVKRVQTLLDQYQNRGAEFDKANPFSFSDVLAAKTKEVGSRLDPYYTQTLGDFMRGINLQKQRSVQDTQNVLGDINADLNLYKGQNRDLLDQALKTSAEGSADSGLFFSGQSQREQGNVTRAADYSLQGKQLQSGIQSREAGLTGARTAENLGIQQSVGTRQLGQQQYYDTQSQALNETNIAQANRELERSQYIGAPFSTTGLSNYISAIPGYISSQ